MAPFLFLLTKPALASLPTTLSVALWPPFPFPLAQFVQVFLLKPAPFCKLSAGRGSTNKSVISLLFSFSPTLPLFLPLCSLLHLSFHFNLCGRNCLLSPPLSLGYNGSPDTRFSRGTTQLMSWPDGERYLSPPQSVVVSILLSLVSTLLFSRIGGVLPHRNSSTYRFPRFPLGNLCSLVMLAVTSLVFAATDTALCRALISLKLAEPRIIHAAPAVIRPRISLISFCTIQLPTFCAARSLPNLCLSTTSGPGPRELLGSWAPWSSSMPLSFGRGRATITTWHQARFQTAFTFCWYITILITPSLEYQFQVDDITKGKFSLNTINGYWMFSG